MTSATGIVTKKLGKKPPRHDVRTLHLFDYVDRKELPSPPESRDWFAGLPADLGMMANDRYGDCGFAGLGHAKATWTHATGNLVVPGDDEILQWYRECTGFDPNDPATDNGVVLLDALNYFRKKGLIAGFAKIDHGNLAHLRITIELFGGTYAGVSLPRTAADLSRPWTGAPTDALTGDDKPDSWGGHCVWGAQFTPDGFTWATWGQREFSDNQWNLDYLDEAYAILSNDWVTGDRQAPSGFDLEALLADLAAL